MNKGGRGNVNSRSLRVLSGQGGAGKASDLPPGLPPPPEWLSGKARDYFLRLGAVLAQVGLLTPADGPLFGQFCLCLARIVELEAQVTAEGPVVRSPQGVKPHPAARLAEGYRKQLIALAQQFGLTPKARGSLDVVPQAAQDELARLLEGR